MILKLQLYNKKIIFLRFIIVCLIKMLNVVFVDIKYFCSCIDMDNFSFDYEFNIFIYFIEIKKEIIFYFLIF